jgi:hypothetical protein
MVQKAGFSEMSNTCTRPPGIMSKKTVPFKLVLAEMVKIFPTFCETIDFITVFRRACYWTVLSQVDLIHILSMLKTHGRNFFSSKP